MTHSPDSPRPRRASPHAGEHAPHFDPAGSHADNSQYDDAPSRNRWAALGGWAIAILAAVALGATAIWQVNERVYTPESTAGQYWDALREGSGARALGLFDTVPEFEGEAEVDHLLLSGAPLAASISQIESPELTDASEGGSPELSFTVDGQEHATELPTALLGQTWGFFDHWAMASRALSWFQVEVPGAVEGGIAQVEVNGEPVNLDSGEAALSAFVPTVAEVEIDSQWLQGSAEHVVTSSPEDGSAQRLTIDLEASEAAVDLLHEEVGEFFDGCAQEQVLMPTACPVGATTTNRVDASTIEWEFPSPDAVSLSFDADGWSVNYDQLTAVLTYEADDSFTGERLQEREEMTFDIEVDVAASESDLMVSVQGLDEEGAQ